MNDDVMYLASMIWPVGNEPICVGKNRQKTVMTALKILREHYGSGVVVRPKAMCSVPIEQNDICVDIIPVV